MRLELPLGGYINLVKRDKINSAVRWSAIDSLVRYSLSFVITVVLARILVPADFGIVGMLAVFIAIASMFIDSGFSLALIQRQTTTNADESTIFYFNLIIGALVALALCSAASWIAAFYQQPILNKIIYLMALNLCITAFGSIHMTLLTKKLDFKTITWVGAVSTLISGISAILMALSGWGVWALILQTIVGSLISVAMLWILHPWRPQWIFSRDSLRSFFRFGGFILLTNSLYNLYINLYSLIIGKLYSARDVGFFSRAQSLHQLPFRLIEGIVGRIAFPLFAEAAGDKVKLVRGMRKAQAMIMLINIPLMIGLIILADHLVETLLGVKWAPVVPILRVLSIAGILLPLQSLNLDVLKAQGHSDLNARIMLFKLVIGISLLIGAARYGIMAIAWGYAVSSVSFFMVNAYYTRVFLDYGALAQLRDLMPYFGAVIPMASVMWLVAYILVLPVQTELAVALVMGGMVYLVTCKITRPAGYEELIAFIRRK